MMWALVLMAEINHDDFDARRRSGVGCGDQALGVLGIENQQVDPFRDHVLDVGDLLAHLVLGVRLRGFATRLLGLIDGGGDLRREIRGAQRVHSDADLTACRLGAAVGTERERDAKRNRRNGCLH